MDNNYLMSRDIDTVSEHLLVTFHKTVSALNGALHRHLPVGLDLQVGLGDGRILTVTGQDEKSNAITVEELGESTEQAVVLGRFIFRRGRQIDIIDETGQYRCPRAVGASALRTHIHAATIVHDHFRTI
jgi:hypothetical protein